MFASPENQRGTLLVSCLIIITILGVAASASIGDIGLQNYALNNQQRYQQLFWDNYRELQLQSIQLQQLSQQELAALQQSSSAKVSELSSLSNTENTLFEVKLYRLPSGDKLQLHSRAYAILSSGALGQSNQQFQRLHIQIDKQAFISLIPTTWGLL